MLSYKKQKEALLKEAQQHREVVKDGIAPIVSASQSKGKKVLLVAGGAALAYGLANWYFKSKSTSSENQEEKTPNVAENNTPFSFVDMLKQEAATLLTTFVKEQMNNFLQKRNS